MCELERGLRRVATEDASRRRRVVLVGAGALALSAVLAWCFWPGPGRLPLIGTLRGIGTPFAPLVFAPEGSNLITNEGVHNAGRHDFAAGQVRYAEVSPDRLFDGAYSPGGRWLALRAHVSPRNTSSIVILDAKTLEERTRLDLDRAIIPHVQFSEDGATLQVLSWDRFYRKQTTEHPDEVQVWDVPDWTLRSSSFPPIRQYRNVEVSPDFRSLAGSDDRTSGVTLHDLKTGAIRASLLDSSAPEGVGVNATRYSSDGSFLAVGRSDGAIEVWDVSTRTLLKTLRGFSSGYRASNIGWTQDGRTILAVGRDLETTHFAAVRRGLRSLWWREPRNAYAEVVVWDVGRGRVRAKLRDEGMIVTSPDNSTLATIDIRRTDTIHLWRLSAPRR